MKKIDYLTGMPVPMSLLLKSIKTTLRQQKGSGKVFFVGITSGKMFKKLREKKRNKTCIQETNSKCTI